MYEAHHFRKFVGRTRWTFRYFDQSAGDNWCITSVVITRYYHYASFCVISNAHDEHSGDVTEYALFSIPVSLTGCLRILKLHFTDSIQFCRCLGLLVVLKHKRLSCGVVDSNQQLASAKNFTLLDHSFYPVAMRINGHIHAALWMWKPCSLQFFSKYSSFFACTPRIENKSCDRTHSTTGHTNE